MKCLVYCILRHGKGDGSLFQNLSQALARTYMLEKTPVPFPVPGIDGEPVRLVSHLHFAHGGYVPNEDVTPRVPAEMEARAWKLIDERINCLRLHAIGLGQAGWQERSRQLFDLAGQLPRTPPGPPKP